MAVVLENVVPWGRSLAEYREMFALTAVDEGRRILGCADGPASFNAEMTAQGTAVRSIDPLYQFSAAQIEQRVHEAYPLIMNQVRQTMADYVWTTIPSPERLGEIRLAAMARFLQDYEAGQADGRYQPISLPHLPFAGGEFGLALCSHFLFLYSEQLSFDFHVTAVREMVRVAGEVRIFPLLDLNCRESVHVRPLLEIMKGEGMTAVIETVNYEFQRGGNQLLRLSQDGI
ncbi:MAG: SAM-dependent methyltransferase [Anaerolineae bacterium]|nr:SAM-dependent methyltransferase [Anaerolineae bacterium]